MYEKREIYRAIAEVAYAIARAGDGLQSEEREKFYQIIQGNLDFDAWSAQSRFELMEKIHPSPEKAFDYALGELKKYEDHLTPELKESTLRIAEAVANAYAGKNSDEDKFLQRLKSFLDE